MTLALFPLEKRNFSIDLRGDPRFQRAYFNGGKGRPQAIYPLPINYPTAVSSC